MRNQAFAFKFLLAGGLYLAASMSMADIVKCRDATGAISYTDSACSENARLERIVINDSTLSYDRTPASTEPKDLKQTVWATKQFAYRTKPDVESIRVARLNALSMERARFQR
jgi:hypothetical protein